MAQQLQLVNVLVCVCVCVRLQAAVSCPTCFTLPDLIGDHNKLSLATTSWKQKRSEQTLYGPTDTNKHTLSQRGFKQLCASASVYRYLVISFSRWDEQKMLEQMDAHVGDLKKKELINGLIETFICPRREIQVSDQQQLKGRAQKKEHGQQ